jgi:rubrerythrin
VENRDVIIMSKSNKIEEALDFALKQEIKPYSFYLELADFIERMEMAKSLPRKEFAISLFPVL